MSDVQVSLIFPTHNRKEMMRELLTTLPDRAGADCEVIVIDDASTDGTALMIQNEFPAVRVIRNDVA